MSAPRHALLLPERRRFAGQPLSKPVARALGRADRLPDADGWAPEVGFIDGFPAARDPKALFELQIGAVTPALQKGYTWFKTVGDLAGQAQADVLKLVEAGMSQWLQSVIVTLESVNRNVPVGSEFAVKALKTAVANASPMRRRRRRRRRRHRRRRRRHSLLN